MTREEAIECAKKMTYQEAIRNTIYAKGVRYKKATRIKLQKLAEIADALETQSRVRRLPSADRPSGKWIRYKRCDAVDDEIYALMEAPKGEFFCNQCGKSAIKSNYCPNCGAYMGERREP